MASKADIAQEIFDCARNPYAYAVKAFPWGMGELVGMDGPRAWQREVMEEIAAHLGNPATRHTPLRIARASGHGIGKSALIAMLNKWALDTMPDTRIVITANTENQLLTKTSPELAKWARLAVTKDWFKINATSITSTAKERDKSWRCDLVTWSANNTEAFAGLHNQGKRIMLIFDEASGIDKAVWEVALGALTDEGTEIIWLAFGNPTQNTGSFRECFGKARNLWSTQQIDSRTVEGTNKAYLQELVDTYGIGSDVVKVRVLGQFPSASSMQFIGNDLADAARDRGELQPLKTEPVIFGVDCARFGDDESVLAIRQGRDAVTRPWKTWGKTDAMTLAGDIALQAQRWHPDAIFVDAGNIGAAVVDRLRQLMEPSKVFEVWFGGKGRDANWNGAKTRVANKRAEMWCNMRDWLGGGSIPREQRLYDDLIGPEYGFDAEQAIILERKEHMKKRGLPSPDWGDALACTFAEPVLPRDLPEFRNPDNYQRQSEAVDLYAELGGD
ncbi:hypothetical protein UFOVP5_51 [uncultured Caudovirales phage]|uniref:Terminase n=1 Tax=uncultured Caudovirales phage TaxID=2100421 RepID=A0A6J5KFW3_9CAUD|nr:hypothetical protein UFOVP5_51 [uncultured Caudovirales phage]